MIAQFDSESAPLPGANGSTPTAPAAPSVEGLLFAAGAISADQLGEVVRDAVMTDRPVAAVAVERGFVTRDALADLLNASGSHVSVAEALGEQTHVAPVVVEPAPSAPVAEHEDAEHVVIVAAPRIVAEEQAVSAMPVQVPVPAMSQVQQAVAAAANGALPAEPAPVALVPASEPVLEVAQPPQVAQPPEPALAVVLPVEADVQPSTPTSAAFAVFVRLESGDRVAVDTSDSFEDATELAREFVETLSTSGEWPFVSGRFIRPAGIVSIDIERALGD